MGNGNIRPQSSRSSPVVPFQGDKKWKNQLKFSSRTKYVESSLFRWKPVTTTGSCLHERSGHSLSEFGKCNFLIFGGLLRSQPTNSEIHEDQSVIFNVKTEVCTELRCYGRNPPSRASHAVCSDNAGNIYVVGGTTANGLLGDMYKLNYRTLRWHRLKFSDEVSKKVLNLYGHSLVYYQNRLISFGGTAGMSYTSLSCSFDLESETWSTLQTTGRRPSPRYQHKAFIPTKENSDSMYILGGGNFRPCETFLDIYSLDLVTLNWNKLFCSGPPPISRFAFDLTYDAHSHSLYIFGGLAADLSTMDDLYCLELYTMSWKKIVTKNNPPKRAFHTLFGYNSHLFLLGGANGLQRYETVWKFQIRQEVKSLLELAAQCLMRHQRRKKKNNKVKNRYLALENTAALSESLPCELRDYMMESFGEKESNLATAPFLF
mmetsp:Transcript_7458/g.9941  ORF Transcript_7458/g.9941 Transcript_7458/m.9941 type:complete len:431 (-) Transcript_7458:82-1374(-)